MNRPFKTKDLPTELKRLWPGYRSDADSQSPAGTGNWSVIPIKIRFSDPNYVPPGRVNLERRVWDRALAKQATLTLRPLITNSAPFIQFVLLIPRQGQSLEGNARQNR